MNSVRMRRVVIGASVSIPNIPTPVSGLRLHVHLGSADRMEGIWHANPADQHSGNAADDCRHVLHWEAADAVAEADPGLHGPQGQISKSKI